MMRYDLRAMIRRTRATRRKAITLRDIAPPAIMATDLFRASYLPVVQLWERYIPRLVSEYERTLSQMTQDSPADLQAALDAAETEFDRLFILLEAGLRDWALQTESWSRDKWRGAVLSATGIELGTLIGPSDVRQTVEASIQWNVSLVKDLSAEAEKRFANIVFAGVNQRKPAREVAAELREASAMSRRRATAIASDQMSKLTSSLADERRRQAGIEVWRWRHSGKLHPRAQHVARDNKLYADTAAGADEAKGINPPPADLPSKLPYCGCRAQAYIDLDD